ncbi:MAG: ribonuclease D [Pseudohongiellaceae bacterium]
MSSIALKPPVDYRYIADDAALAACCVRWRQARALALDTEFMRVSTFYPKAALFQVSDGEEITLVDPLGISHWAPFRALLADPALVKILHSCSEDLLVFLNGLQVLPAPLFDTQVAASMLEHGLSVSYQNMVKHYFGVELPKAETRSDWLQRPLTPEQREYAALDVAYLHQIWDLQCGQLERLGRGVWMKEECSRLAEPYAAEISGDFSGQYRDFGAAWQLGPRQLAALQKLAEWRERRARARDKPRSWIIKDNALFAMAQGLVGSKAQLALIPEVSDNFIRFEGEQVLALIAEARQLNEADCPPPLPKPLTQGQKNRLRKARELIEAKAAELGVSPEFLGRKRTLHALFHALDDKGAVDAARLPPELLGWRESLILNELIGMLRP